MNNLMIRIHNVEINEVIDREMNDEELAQYELDQANFAIKKQELIEQAEAKASLLTKLGITADEAALLLEVTQ